MFLVCRMKPEYLRRKSSVREVKLWPSCCEMTVLTAALPCHPCENKLIIICNHMFMCTTQIVCVCSYLFCRIFVLLLGLFIFWFICSQYFVLSGFGFCYFVCLPSILLQCRSSSSLLSHQLSYIPCLHLAQVSPLSHPNVHILFSVFRALSVVNIMLSSLVPCQSFHGFVPHQSL